MPACILCYWKPGIRAHWALKNLLQIVKVTVDNCSRRLIDWKIIFVVVHSEFPCLVSIAFSFELLLVRITYIVNAEVNAFSGP